jgi:hypothetical protein
LSIPGGHTEGPASQHISLKRDDVATPEMCHSAAAARCEQVWCQAANTSWQEGRKPELWCVVLHMHMCVIVIALVANRLLLLLLLCVLVFATCDTERHKLCVSVCIV